MLHGDQPTVTGKSCFLLCPTLQLSATEEKLLKKKKKAKPNISPRVPASKIVCSVKLIIHSLILVHTTSELDHWKIYTVKTHKNGMRSSEEIPGKKEKKGPHFFSILITTRCCNMSCKYYIWWILYLSTFLSTEFKSSSASAKDMLKTATCQIRFLLCLSFFSNIFSCQMLLRLA